MRSKEDEGIKIGVSLGTSSVLGLTENSVCVKPSTAYLIMHGKCQGKCAFCYWNKGNKLSRVRWPSFPMSEVIDRIKKKQNEFRRICIQTILKDGFEEELIRISSKFSNLGLPLSVSTQPLRDKEVYSYLDRISIPLDCATPELFSRLKGEGVGNPFRWEDHIRALKESVKEMGEFRVHTNLIVGLGESELDAIEFIFLMKKMGVNVNLFAYTPMKGRKGPPITTYRKIQLARYLIFKEELEKSDIETREGKIILKVREVPPGAFETSGCPGCNRPFYNEGPLGPIYNYPRPLSREELREIEVDLIASGEVEINNRRS